MPRVHKRKYEKIEQAEIDLVVQCSDSHEFYERYRQEFPTRKKGIDSISKIWKRRGEFLKKLQGPDQPEIPLSGSTKELEQLVAAQGRMLAEISGLLREQVKISRDILTHLQKPVAKSDEPVHKSPVEKSSDPAKESPKKATGHEKPRADIMIGS